MVDYDPGQRAAEVDDLVHQKGHDARSEDVILHVRIPRSPEALKNIKVDIVFRYLVELAPVSVLGHIK